MQNPRHHQIYFQLEETTQKASILILDVTSSQFASFRLSVAVQDLKEPGKPRRDKNFPLQYRSLIPPHDGHVLAANLDEKVLLYGGKTQIPLEFEFTIQDDRCADAEAVLRCERDKLIVDVESRNVYRWVLFIHGNKQDLEYHEVVNARPSFKELS